MALKYQTGEEIHRGDPHSRGARRLRVAANVPFKPTKECLSQQLFYRLRRGFRSQLKAPASTFDLDTPLKQILHRDQWPQVWEASL